jgi:hypothetical protein
VGFVDPKRKDPTDPESDLIPVPDQPIAVHARQDLSFHVTTRTDSYLAAAITGFFANGGIRCYVACVDFSQWRNKQDPMAAAVDLLEGAVKSLDPLDDMDLIAIPDAMVLRRSEEKLRGGGFKDLDKDAVLKVQKRLLKHCAKRGDRFALLDPLPGSTVDDVRAQRKDVVEGEGNALNGAIYYPWLRIDSDTVVPPSGHVAGIYARTDARVGVFKAPANEPIVGTLALETDTSLIQDKLNDEGINCIRAFPGRGIRVWGARTLSKDRKAPHARYVNVRRLIITLKRWIDARLAWVCFEPNSPRLWLRIQREVGVELTRLWQAGALKGQSEEEAFYVKCDDETNPPDGPQDRVVSEIGLAVAVPAEFVVVQIIHHSGAG